MPIGDQSGNSRAGELEDGNGFGLYYGGLKKRPFGFFLSSERPGGNALMQLQPQDRQPTLVRNFHGHRDLII
jgi:hypothetical protein